MKRFSIAVKIWLAVGLFVAGFVIATVLGQIESLATEQTLKIASAGLFPAAQRSQDAEAAFQRMTKAFGDAVLVQDASGLDRASEEGKQVVTGLKAIASNTGIAPEQAAAAGKLAGTVEQFGSEARSVYGTVLATPAKVAEMQGRMAQLSTTTEMVKASLRQMTAQYSQQLHDQLGTAAARSANQRVVSLVVFGLTVLIAAVLVNVTIRRAITGPIQNVIRGVKQAADNAAEASEQMATSGDKVARHAQEQAAYLQETSASLEEISATTKENAHRAGEADRMMREATQSVTQATQAMQQLKQSMDEVSKSSRQVSGVLKSIDEIAFNTNILALNAAVEAARAGEAGAGFSVVAEEVRSLARRAAEAARSSAEIVEKTISDVARGVNLVASAHNAFQQVAGSISEGGKAVSRIAASSNEQARGIAQIGEAITRLESVTQGNAANAQKTAEGAASVTHQVEATRQHLNELVQVVGVDPASLTLA